MVVWGYTGSLSSKNNQRPIPSVKLSPSEEREEKGTGIYYIHFTEKETETGEVT